MNRKKRLSLLLAGLVLSGCISCAAPGPEGPGSQAPATSGAPGTDPVVPPREPVVGTYEYTLIDTSKQFNFYEVISSYNEEEHKFLIRVPRVEAYDEDEAEAAARMDRTIGQLNAMANSEAGVNVWVYAATCLEGSELMLDIIPTEYKGSNLDYFRSRLSEKVWLGTLEPYDIEERNRWYLSTDHHWSPDGMYQAYTQIIEAMSRTYSDMIPAREAPLQYTDAWYFGSLSRSASKYPYKDQFRFYNFALPEHETIVLRVNKDKTAKDPNGKLLYGSPVPFAQNVAKYTDGTFEKNEKFDHYINFFPICDKVVYPENQTGRNLLFIGDSFSLGLQELIASHFDTTFFFYSDGTKALFRGQDLADYCEANGITDVLVLEQSTRILYDFYDYSGPALASFTVSR